jgi:tetratricopeptide (TPR) repeat protein
MNRLLTGVLLSIMACAAAKAQSSQPASTQHQAGERQISDLNLDKSQVQHLISLNEDAAREGERAHVDRARLVTIYTNLGILYAEIGMPLKAEDAMHRTIDLLQDGPQDQLAEEIGQLAVLHVAMNQLKKAEKEELQALEIRKAVADPVGIALAQSALAGLYDDEKKYTRALEYAEPANAAITGHQDVAVADRIGVLHTLGYALTGSRNCARGIQTLEDALEVAKNSTELSRSTLGYSEYMLGYGYWHCGNRQDAAKWLQLGTTDMRTDYGWPLALYVHAMKEYARFLRESGERDAALAAEAVVNQAGSVVDASTLTDRSSAFHSAGFR